MAGGVPAGRLNIEIVAEIARLQQDLDKAKKAVNAASNDIAKSARAANDNLAGMAGGIAKTGAQSKLASHHMANLSFQIQDIIVGLQGGQKPMTVFLQQGGQIGQIMMQARMGVLGLTKALLGMASAAVIAVATNPAFLALAGTITLVGAALGLVTEEINKNSTVTVTWQDVLLGAFDVVRDAISSKVTSAFEAMGLDIGEVWESVKKYTRTAINWIIGAALVVPKTIAATYDKIGPAIGDAFYSAANLAIEALNWLVKKSAVPINLIIDGLNRAFGTDIPKVVVGGIDKIAYPYAGAMGRLGSAGAKAFGDAFRTDHIGNVAGALKDASVNRAIQREAEKAGEKAGKAAGSKAGKAAGKSMADEWLKALEKGLSDAQGNIIKLGMKLGKELGNAIAAQTNAELALVGRAANDNFMRANDAILSAARANVQWNEQLRASIAALDMLGRKGQNLGDIGAILQGMSAGDWSGARGPIAHLMQIQWRDSWEDGGTIRKLGEEFNNALKGVFGDNFPATLANLLQGAGTGAAIGSIAFGGSKSAQLGSTIGGALGQEFGKQLLGSALGKLGGAAGPLGAIAGSLLGGVLGGMLNTNRSASAYLTGGDSMLVGGKDKGNYSAATGLGKSVLDALGQIADAFGVSVGNFNTSIGVRGDQIRVNANRNSLKFDQGAVGFGQDSEAALKFAIRDAISDGVFAGLSAGVERLLKGEGDIEAQLQKALSFQSVFSDLEQMKDPQGFALKQLDSWRSSMDAIFTEASATGEELAKLEELYGLKRAEILKQFGEDIVQREKDIRDKSIELLAAQGKTEEALAAARAAELADMPEYLRAIQQQIYAAQDAAAEQERLAEAQRVAADAAAALIEKARQLFGQRMSIEQDILGLQGQITGDPSHALLALKLAREEELRSAEATLRPLLLRKFALQDELTELEKVNAANAEAAALAKARQDEIGGLNRQWLELIGDTATLRAMDLAALQSDEARALQQRIWDYTDAQEAAAAATKAAEEAERARIQAIEDARNVLSQAYERETSALQATIDKFRQFADTIAEFRRGLSLNAGTEAQNFAVLQQQYRDTARMAQFGNEGALGRFTGDAQKYLDAARDQSRSLIEYQSFVDEVTRASRLAERGASGLAAEAQQRMNEITALVSPFIDVIEEAGLSVEDALDRYQAALTVEAVPAFTETVSAGLARLETAVTQGNEKADGNRKVEAYELADLLYEIRREIASLKKEGVPVNNDPSDPLYIREVTP